MLRRAYAARGPGAWKTDKLPWYVTGNAFVASAYADVALGFLRDCRSGRLGRFDPALPVHVVELAAGPGHFGYLFLKSLLELQRAAPELAALKLRFVMSDLAEANVLAWAASDRLRPFVDAGVLDFAVLDAERGRELRLRHKGETLDAATPRNPALVVANYLFDSLPQDLYWLQDKELVEGAVTLRSDREEDLSSPDPGLLARLALGFTPRPAARPCYADDPLAERVLEGYRERLGNGTILFPIGALRVLRNVGELLGPRAVVLTADKGEADESEVLAQGTPRLTLHGGFFSLGVDLNALALYARATGGDALHSRGRDRRLRVSALLLGAEGGRFAETRLAFTQAISRFSPLDYFALSHHLRRTQPAPPPEVALALLRLGRGDGRLDHGARRRARGAGGFAAGARQARPARGARARLVAVLPDGRGRAVRARPAGRAPGAAACGAALLRRVAAPVRPERRRARQLGPVPLRPARAARGAAAVRRRARARPGVGPGARVGRRIRAELDAGA